jgi:hypothetical protein
VGQPADNEGRRARELVAGVAVAVAVMIAVVAVPVVAVRDDDDKGALVSSLPVLVLVSGVAIGVALLALYRIALERASKESPASDARGAATGAGRSLVEGRALGGNRGAPAGSPAPGPGRPATRPAAGAPPPDAGTRVEDRVAEARPQPDGEEVASVVRAEVPRVVESFRAAPPPRGPVERPRERGRRRETPLRESGGARPAAARSPAARQPLERSADRTPAPGPPSGTEDEDPAATETCEIVWWHGARRGGFEARIVGNDRRPRVAERSQMISWREPEPPPPEGPASHAHSALVERLVAQGWQPDEHGAAWYALRFRRKAPLR